MFTISMLIHIPENHWFPNLLSYHYPAMPDVNSCYPSFNCINFTIQNPTLLVPDM